MMMKKVFLFCGALWSIARFTVCYFSLSAELAPSGQLFPLFLLFAFGSAHAVMAAGYCMAAVSSRLRPGILPLLTVGQILASLSDVALLVLGTGLFGLFYTEYETFAVLPGGFSPLPAAAVLTVTDVLFLVCLLLLRDLPGTEQREEGPGLDENVLPEVDETTLEEED